MAETITIDNKKLSGISAEAVEQLSSIFSAYNEITGRMDRSHTQLKAEVQRLREELRQKNELLNRKNRLAALGEMATGVAHEIRNPLGGVQLYASLLEKELTGKKEPLQWVGKIIKGVRSLDVIVNDMLAFTQEQACEKTQVNIAGLLVEVMDYVRPQLKADDIEINLDAVDRKLVGEVDINMMHRVLLNLILNAIEAVGQAGRVEIAVERCSRNEQYKVRISVSDAGPGIDTEVISKIFDPFFTTKDNGTGLGLAIVHRIIESHGGVISATNNKTGGAVFTILLP